MRSPIFTVLVPIAVAAWLVCFGPQVTGDASTLLAADDQPAGKQTLIKISKETTYITEPLDDQGYVDYVAALNAKLKEGVTRENNSAVLYLQAMGPAVLDDEWPGFAL